MTSPLNLGTQRMRRKVLHQTEAARVGRYSAHPLTFTWTHESGTNPVPLASIGPLRELPAPVLLGLTPGPFRFTDHMRALVQDILARTPDLAHIDLNYVLLGISRARTRRPFACASCRIALMRVSPPCHASGAAVPTVSLSLRTSR